eukprot:UN23466
MISTRFQPKSHDDNAEVYLLSVYIELQTWSINQEKDAIYGDYMEVLEREEELESSFHEEFTFNLEILMRSKFISFPTGKYHRILKIQC